MSLSGTGGVRVTIDLCAALIQKGVRVSLVVNQIDVVPFALPEGLSIYKLTPTSLKRVENIRESVRAKGEITPFSAEIRSRLPNWFVSGVVGMQYLLFRLRLVINKRKMKELLGDLNVDCFVSTNIYNKLEYTNLFHDVCRTIIHVHNDLLDVSSRKNFYYAGNLRHFFQRYELIFISEDQRNRAIEAGFARSDSTVIYNPIDFDRIVEKGRGAVDEFCDDYLLFVGSLTDRKRVHLIIKALFISDTKFDLLVIGDGPRLSALRHLVASLGLSARVHFVGFVENPYPYIAQSKGLVLASSSEGLPTVLIEALVLETPIVAVDCPTGPREIMAVFDTEFLIGDGPDEHLEIELSEKFKILENEIEHRYKDVKIFSKERNFEVFMSKLTNGSSE